MSGRRGVSDWRRGVFRSAALSDRTKVLLVYLADHMRQDLRVSVPREKVAADLGKSERRITERITEAHDAGWLDTIVRGQKGVTAVYVGTFPDAVSGTDARPLKRRQSSFSGTPTSPLNSAETRPLNTPNHALRGRTCVPPIEERTSSVGLTDADVGSYEEHDGPDPSLSAHHADHAPACQWHGWQPCPRDCANYAEETA